MLEQLEMQVQMQERGDLEGRERPLVRERDVADPGMLQEIADVCCRSEKVGLDLRASDQPPLLGEALEQTQIAHQLVVGRGTTRDGAEDPLAVDEDVPGWVAEGSWLGPAGDHCLGGSAGRPCALRSFGVEEKNPLTLPQ